MGTDTFTTGDECDSSDCHFEHHLTSVDHSDPNVQNMHDQSKEEASLFTKTVQAIASTARIHPDA